MKRAVRSGAVVLVIAVVVDFSGTLFVRCGCSGGYHVTRMCARATRATSLSRVSWFSYAGMFLDLYTIRDSSWDFFTGGLFTFFDYSPDITPSAPTWTGTHPEDTSRHVATVFYRTTSFSTVDQDYFGSSDVSSLSHIAIPFFVLVRAVGDAVAAAETAPVVYVFVQWFFLRGRLVSFFC